MKSIMMKLKILWRIYRSWQNKSQGFQIHSDFRIFNSSGLVVPSWVSHQLEGEQNSWIVSGSPILLQLLLGWCESLRHSASFPLSIHLSTTKMNREVRLHVFISSGSAILYSSASPMLLLCRDRLPFFR